MVKAKSIFRQTLLCVLAISFFSLVINPVNALAQQSTPVQSSDSHLRLIYILLGGLVVLLIAMIFVIIYMLKMFKRRF
jgi:uncharacterized membrane protein